MVGLSVMIRWEVITSDESFNSMVMLPNHQHLVETFIMLMIEN
jgi:hypothetical protein